MANIPITTDQYNVNSTPGYAYTASGDVVTISANVLVGSGQGDGVISSGMFSNSSIMNNGNILSGETSGITFNGDGGHITNNDGGQIIGQETGILVGGSTVLQNHGRIFGLVSTGILMGFGSHDVSVTNDGEIYGRDRGIHVGSSLIDGGTINNTGLGLIHSDHTGIEVSTSPGLRTFINNGEGATIRGGDYFDPDDYSVHTFDAGGIWLVNEGDLRGTVRCDAANENDTVINRGIIRSYVYLGSGNDVYNGLGGGTATRPIQCGVGSDTFIAGVRREVVYGQAGADTFEYRSVSFSAEPQQGDVIQAFSRAEGDKIDVHYIDADSTHAGRQAFTFIGTDTFAHYNSLHPGVVGMLRFDPVLDRLRGNVNGNFATIEFDVALPGVAALFASDFILV